MGAVTAAVLEEVLAVEAVAAAAAAAAAKLDHPACLPEGHQEPQAQLPPLLHLRIQSNHDEAGGAAVAEAGVVAVGKPVEAALPVLRTSLQLPPHPTLPRVQHGAAAGEALHIGQPVGHVIAGWGSLGSGGL
jgi:hypothetical protein